MHLIRGQHSSTPGLSEWNECSGTWTPLKPLGGPESFIAPARKFEPESSQRSSPSDAISCPTTPAERSSSSSSAVSRSLREMSSRPPAFFASPESTSRMISAISDCEKHARLCT